MRDASSGECELGFYKVAIVTRFSQVCKIVCSVLQKHPWSIFAKASGCKDPSPPSRRLRLKHHVNSIAQHIQPSILCTSVFTKE